MSAPEPMGPGGAAEEGFQRRLQEMLDADPQGRLLLGDGPRIFPGWPDDTGQEPDFPRLTLETVSDVVVLDGRYHQLRIRVHVWFWPRSQRGRPRPLTLVNRIEAWVLRILSGARWEFDRHHLEALAVGTGQQFRGGENRASRRTRDFRVDSALILTP